VTAVILIPGLALLLLAGIFPALAVLLAAVLATLLAARLVGRSLVSRLLPLPLGRVVLKEGANRLSARPSLAGAQLVGLLSDAGRARSDCDHVRFRVADALAQQSRLVLLNRGVRPLVLELLGVLAGLGLPKHQRLRVRAACEEEELTNRAA